MTRTKFLTLATLATGLGLASMVGSAADMNNKCSDMTYKKEFLDKYPKAPAVCRTVSVKNGVHSAMFSGRVMGVDKGSVTVQFTNVVGDPVAGMDPLTFTPASGAKLHVNGKTESYKDLKKGDKLDFWVSENRVGVVTDPEEVTTVTPGKP
jgi:hypothetical protein